MDLRMAELPLVERYKLVTGLVVPRPIAWISTVSAAGVANCAPYSFFNAFAEDPPLVMVSFGPRLDRKVKHSLKNTLDTGEFVVNLVDEDTANAMHICASSSSARSCWCMRATASSTRTPSAFPMPTTAPSGACTPTATAPRASASRCRASCLTDPRRAQKPQ